MSEEKKRWWEIEDPGGWPGFWTRPPLYISDPNYRTRPKAERWDTRNTDWRLRPHP